MFEITNKSPDLDEAVRAYERGFYLRNDYYNGINFAFLLNVRAAAHTDRAEAIADFVHAARVRHEVLSICAQWLQDNPRPDEDKVTVKAMNVYRDSRYWVLATKAEARLGTGDPDADRYFEEAYQLRPPDWMIDSTKEQRGKLTALLADPPLRYVVRT